MAATTCVGLERIEVPAVGLAIDAGIGHQDVAGSQLALQVLHGGQHGVGSVTSAAAQAARPPSATIACGQFGQERLAAGDQADLRARRANKPASARPMPLEAPVISTHWSRKKLSACFMGAIFLP